MIRYLASLCFALFSAAAAALPSAPFTDQAIERIDSAWAVNAEGFQQELAMVNQGSPEAYYVLGRYMSAAFEGAGYSLDETLYIYLAKSGPGTTQMHLFMQKMNLGPFFMQLNNVQYRDALLQSGALSERTVKFAQKQDPKAPIAEADFIFEGDPVIRVTRMHTAWTISRPAGFSMGKALGVAGSCSRPDTSQIHLPGLAL